MVGFGNSVVDWNFDKQKPCAKTMTSTKNPHSILNHLYGLTQAAAAARLGITPATLRAWRLSPPDGAIEVAHYLLSADLAALDFRRPSAADVEVARKVAGMTQAAAASLLGVTVGTWSTWATGETVMPFWRWVCFGLWTRRAAIPAGGLGAPDAATVREVRLISGVTLAQAAALVHLRAAVDWELFERPDMAVPIPEYLWELFVLRVAAGADRPAPLVADLRAAREVAGLTQAAAALLVHATRESWASWETSGRRIPSARLDLFALKVSSR